MPWAWCEFAFLLGCRRDATFVWKLRWPGQLCLESGARVASCWQSPAGQACLPTPHGLCTVGLGTRNSGDMVCLTQLTGLALLGRGGPSAHTAPGWACVEAPWAAFSEAPLGTPGVMGLGRPERRVCKNWRSLSFLKVGQKHRKTLFKVKQYVCGQDNV